MSELPGKEITGPVIGDGAVQKATGKIWSDWFKILDKAGAGKMSHKEIVKYLHDNHQIGPWWQQMVTVQYELKRGIRKKHQKKDGYQISRSKTISAPVAKLYNAWYKTAERKKWLKDYEIKITTAQENKTIRGRWKNESIPIEIYFYEKEAGKTQVVVQNSKIKSASEAEKLKNYWKTSLGNLSDQTSI